jgi:hypothetical protein
LQNRRIRGDGIEIRVCKESLNTYFSNKIFLE